MIGLIVIYILIFVRKFRLLKSIFGILLLLAFIARPTAKIGIVGYYGLNIKNIVEKYCINKDKPVLKCNGKCYLKKQLEFSSADASSGTNNINFSEAFIPVFIHLSDNITFKNTSFSQKQKIESSNNKLLQELLLFKIEYPPEFS